MNYALITGGSSGIGLEYARHMAARGWNIIVVSNREDDNVRVANELSAQYGVVAEPLYADLTEADAAEKIFGYTEQRGIKVDVLINNAGIFSFCDILNTPIERIQRMIMLHDITATLNCRLYAADMIKRGGGRILNMSSFSIWMPYPGLSLYSASKAYLKSFSVAFAKEVKDKGVTVTAICPAGIATDLYGLSPKLQRFGVRTGILMTPDGCARRSLNGMFRGQRVKVPDWWFRLFIPICQLVRGPIMKWLRGFTMQFQK